MYCGIAGLAGMEEKARRTDGTLYLKKVSIVLTFPGQTVFIGLHKKLKKGCTVCTSWRSNDEEWGVAM